MATPRRQPPIRHSSSDQDAAVRTKTAAMTYSFAQQIPNHQASLPPPPPPPSSTDNTTSQHSSTSVNPSASNESNFPKLIPSVSSVYKSPDKFTSYSQVSRSFTQNTSNLSKIWDASSTTSIPVGSRPVRWTTPTRKTATAAEVVASKPLDSPTPVEDRTESEKHKAELDLISKLVPTTSAVPRNPGRSLGGGGLRATGSVAAQKSTRATPSSTLVAPQPILSLSRKEPMTSRMRSLSSDASKPQLARRVAKPNRTTTPTPQDSMDRSTSPSNLSNDAKFMNSVLDDVHDKKQVADRDLIANGNVERSMESTRVSSSQRPSQATGGAPIVSILQRDADGFPRNRISDPPSRRLEEAFRGTSRLESGKIDSPPASRKPSSYLTRRPSGISPPPSHPSQRRYGGRESTNPNHWQGNKSTNSDSATNAIPPGFESRSSGGSRGGVTPRGKSDFETTASSNPRDKEPPLAPPPNSRADALREAFSFTRKSNNTRPPLRRRSSPAEQTNESTEIPSTLKVIAARRNAAHHHGNEAPMQKLSAISESIERPKAVESVVSEEHNIERKMKPNGTSGKETTKDDEESHATVAGNVKKIKEVVNGSAGNQSYNAFENINGHVAKMNIDSSDGITEERRASAPSLSTESPNFRFDVAQGRTLSIHCGLDGYEEDRRDFVASNDNFNIQELNGWPNRIEDHGRNSSESLLGRFIGYNSNDYGHCTHDLNGGRRSDNNGRGNYSMNEDVLNNTVLNIERGEDVLPPLPNSEEPQFESVLRQMGWRPADEEEAPQNYIANGLVAPMMQRRNLDGQGNVNGNVGRNGNTMQVSGPYYSHFH